MAVDSWSCPHVLHATPALAVQPLSVATAQRHPSSWASGSTHMGCVQTSAAGKQPIELTKHDPQKQVDGHNGADLAEDSAATATPETIASTGCNSSSSGGAGRRPEIAEQDSAGARGVAPPAGGGRAGGTAGVAALAAVAAPGARAEMPLDGEPSARSPPPAGGGRDDEDGGNGDEPPLLPAWRGGGRQETLSPKAQSERRLLEGSLKSLSNGYIPGAGSAAAPLTGLNLKLPEELLLPPGSDLRVGRQRRDERLDSPDAELLSMVEDERVVLEELDGELGFHSSGLRH